MKNKIVIFGSGVWGKTAYQYYKNKAEIICFVDNREEICGTIFDGVPICSPEILNKYELGEIGIVIAVKDSWKEIQQQLYIDYNISESIIFQIEEQYMDSIYQEGTFDSSRQEIIICYSSGLGNQMFQYALSRCFAKKENRVVGDLTSYSLLDNRTFILPLIFPNVIFEKCNYATKVYYEKIVDCLYKEPAISTIDYLETDMSLLEVKQGMFKGYWQNWKYAEIVKEELYHDFEFRNTNDFKLKKIINWVSNRNTVSVHIRRGDYLQIYKLYGNICTDIYYEKAMNYIMQQEKSVIFVFLSDDIDWVSEKYKNLENVIFIRTDMFDAYEDWYDMCIMSHCKHNIIANSTFSWWGAWLNKNPYKIVVAPQKWINGTEIQDICPVDWIRM